MEKKNCKECGLVFNKNKKESWSQFAARAYCGFACYGRVKSRKLTGATSPMKGRKHSVESKHRNRVSHLGALSSLWKGGLTLNRKAYYRLKGVERRAVELGAEGKFTHEEWLEVKEKFGCRCAICFKPESQVFLTIDHVKPLTKGGTNWSSNLQPLCQPCNSRKGNRIYA